jgi:hypothetical protein
MGPLNWMMARARAARREGDRRRYKYEQLGRENESYSETSRFGRIRKVVLVTMVLILGSLAALLVSG